MKTGYIPKEERKKILLLSDDLRMPSGVGNMSREIVLGTAHRYNWVQLGASVQHPDEGKIFDASNSLSEEANVVDASLKIYPSTGYGDANKLRSLILMEKPDAILHFTDPHYWAWLYQIEHEIRAHMPILYYHVWDNLPFPQYNESYYRSCDYIACISRQTYNIVKQVWKKDAPEPWQVQYVPHGINERVFFKPERDEDLNRVAKLKSQIFNGEEVDFVVLYNNRNLRRKMTSDVVLAFREFFLSLTPEQQKKTRLLMHTQPVDQHGTDLIAVLRDIAPEIPVVFSSQHLEPGTMNDLYAISDVVINLSSAEGFGLGTLEALLAEKMIIANVTGGLQDQMGFRDEDGTYLHEDIHYNAEWGSNHDGKYTNHGEWVVPIFPSTRALVGSPQTPYIFDDRCSWKDAGTAIRKVYDMGSETRNVYGKLGKEYAQSQGLTATTMCERFVDGIDRTFENWTPRKPFTMVKA